MNLTKKRLEELILLELKLSNKFESLEERNILGLHGRDPKSYGRVSGGQGSAGMVGQGNRDDDLSPGARADEIIGVGNEISSFILAMSDNEEMEKWRELLEPMIATILNHAHEIADQVD